MAQPGRALLKSIAAVAALAVACGTSSIDSERPHSSNASIGSTPLPCSITTIFTEMCSECHGKSPSFGAPMALVTYEDLQRTSRSKVQEKVYERVKARIHDDRDVMPPPPRVLTAEQMAYLDAWLEGRAPSGADCEMDGGVGGSSGAGGDSGAAGVGGASGTVDGGGTSGSAGSGAVGSDDCTPVDFVAHQQQAPADPSPFGIGAGAQFYECFNFKSPWNDPVHGLKFDAVLDNKSVLHHWLLYGTATPSGDGSHAPCIGAHPDAVLLAGWAPGATNVAMPPGVGMELPYGPTANLILEIHYTNTTGTNQGDRSGVRVCATDQLRPETATVSWLGTELIGIAPNSPGVVSSTCTPGYQAGPITILRSWPHMHVLGTAFKTEILRAGGGVETLVDVPNFSFDYQFGYDTPAIINPGDRLVTTCTYNNTNPAFVTFGPRTQDEMCYNFVTSYPAGALTSIGLMARACGL